MSSPFSTTFNSPWLESLFVDRPSALLVACSLAAVVLSSLVVEMGLFSSSKFEPKDKVSRTALLSLHWHCYIGGGSEGLGLSLACQLAQRGAHVSIVSRSQAKLDKALALVETHRQSGSQKLNAYACDLTSSTDASATLHKACEPFGQAPDYIFACAGGSWPKLFVDQDVDEQMKMMDMNFKTALCTIHEGVRRMKAESKPGSIVLVSSVAGLMSFAGYSTYSPSKYAIRGLADGLRNELKLYGIRVHIMFPATIFSPGFETESLTKPQICKTIEGPDEGCTPDQCAAHLIKGVERGEFYITYEPVGKMLRNSRGIVPRNSFVIDTLWGIAGTIGLPVWRIFFADGEVRKEAKRLAKERK